MDVHGELTLSQPLKALSLVQPEAWQAFLTRLKQVAPDATEHAPIWQQITRFSTAQRQAFLSSCRDPVCLSLWHSFNHPGGVFINFMARLGFAAMAHRPGVEHDA